MKIKYLSILLAVATVVLLIAASVNAQHGAVATDLSEESPEITAPVNNSQVQVVPAVVTETSRLDAPVPSSRPRVVYGETDPTSTQPAVYIIQLQDLPLATYAGGIANLAATSPKKTGAHKLDVDSAAGVAYRRYLTNRQAGAKRAIDQLLRRSVQVIYQYNTTFNGLAIKLTPVEAGKLLKLSEIASIQRDQWRYPMTNDSPTFLGVTRIWDGSGTGGLGGSKGEGVIVGVIDTGIWPEHPSFTDDGSFPAPPAGWGGECTAPADNSLGYTCNNKLIGVQFFLAGYTAFDDYDGLFFSGRDDDGHGTHTTSTAAGNENVPASIYGINRGNVSGMAPRAHVAAYKGLGPQGGVTSDLVAAIDKAVADGVDVINYSIGSDFAGDPWVDADALAYLAAREAGVFVATSAGNAGPGPSTVGSPANAPWLTTVGASYFNRLYLSNITFTLTSTVVLTAYGGTSTPGITNSILVSAEGITDTVGDTSGVCENPFAPGTFQATDVVLCERTGNVATWMIGNFIEDGGAGAVILYNSPDNFDYNSYLHPIPAVVVLNETGQQIKELINNNPGATITTTFSQGERVTAPDPRIPTDTIVGFSSRGPNINEATNEFISVMKPDVTAPGIHILAGASPDYITISGGYTGQFGQQGEFFQLIQGTSMSSPHVAGVAALLKALHPDWSPSEMQAALMTTAREQGQKARDESGDNPADPFDIGSGRIAITQAVRAGFVLDETADNFAAVDPFFGGDPSTLNLPSLAQAECVAVCSWTRIISGTQNSSWSVTITAPAGLNLNVNPTNFNLTAGQTQAITVTADVNSLPFGQWVFAQINFEPSSTATVRAHFPVAVRPTISDLPSLVEIRTTSETGSEPIENLKAIQISELAVREYGLTEATLTQESLQEDSNNDNPFDNLTDGVFYITRTVSANTKRFVAEITESESPDLDLYVGLDTGNGTPEPAELVCVSASASAFERCDLLDPGLGLYWVLIQNWQGSASQPDDLTLATAAVPATDNGNMTVTGPASVPGGTPFSVQVAWNTATMLPGARWYGAFDLGTNTANSGNLGVILVDLIGEEPILLHFPLISRN